MRLTPQRIAIVEIIAAKQGHVTADEVYAGIHTRFPYVDISTVYRTLEFLTHLGVLNVIDMGGGRAEATTDDDAVDVWLASDGTVSQITLRLREPTEAAIDERLQALEQQLEDIEATLSEIRAFEAQCKRLLDQGLAPAKASARRRQTAKSD